AGGGEAGRRRRSVGVGGRRPGPGLLLGGLLAQAQPAGQAGGVGGVVVQQAVALGVARLLPAFLLVEAFAQGGLDVVGLGPVEARRLLGRLAPAQQLVLGLGQPLGGRVD